MRTDPDRLVRRVRELATRDVDDEHETRLDAEERPSRSNAQRDRAAQPDGPPAAPPAGGDA
jgi:hypothetical protein